MLSQGTAGPIVNSWLKKLGPGLITGAADDDPSGIATYSQAGAQFGLNMLWTMFFTYPLMVGIEIVSARIGRVSPKLAWTAATITTVVAVFGTTISPYLFFWQASQEVEEIEADPNRKPFKLAPEQARSGFHRIQIDTYFGMGFSNLVAFFIILTTAVTLHRHGVTDIQTSAQAASALRPIAGEFAFILFAAGIIGTGLLAVPVLAGSAAYAMAGAFGWEKGLEQSPAAAKRFYAIIAISTLVEIALGFTPIDPIKALYWSAVVNGVISVPIMAVTMLMAARSSVMGRFVITRKLKWVGWMATIVMTIAVIAMFLTLDYG